jgi:cobalt-zinc-cadmium efflux system membrane fusion protein
MRILHLACLLLTLTLGACAKHDPEHEHEHEPAAVERGPHNGRLLREGPLVVELAIFEDGVPPEFHAWVTRDGRAVAPGSVKLVVTLRRLGGVIEQHEFAVKGDTLVSRAEVYEPHSFDVEVKVEAAGASAAWRYPSYEGRTTIAAAIATQSGIRVAAAGPGTIRDEHDVQGLLTPVEGRRAQVSARFPGPVLSVAVGVGDHVARGATLATIESNLSLTPYAVTAPIGGTVLARDAAVGDQAREQVLFEIADLANLWVDLHLFGSDAQHITPGLPVQVVRLTDGATAATRLDRVLPGTATASQSTVARATLRNDDGRWQPGAAVRARITVAQQPVALVVPLAALQRFRDWQVVFIRDGDTYEVRPLELGRRDGENVEVLGGLREGDLVVVGQSYLIKADIEKSGATHDH